MATFLLEAFLLDNAEWLAEANLAEILPLVQPGLCLEHRGF